MIFKEEHKKMILNGTKTATRRIWKRPMVKIGGVYKCKLKMLSKGYFAKIKVTELYKQELMNMKDEDAKKEGYKNTRDFQEVWIKINDEWNPFLKVDVIEFEVVKK